MGEEIEGQKPVHQEEEEPPQPGRVGRGTVLGMELPDLLVGLTVYGMLVAVLGMALAGVVHGTS